jgi:hypothetical protein
MSTVALHNAYAGSAVSLRRVWEPVWRHRGVIAGNAIALLIVLAIAAVMIWANQTPDASAPARTGLPLGGLLGRR